jgi:hypothetical protein
MSADSELLSIAQVVSRLPGSRGARRVHPATVTRWILAGCPARDGRRVKLAATRAGSRWLVSEYDLHVFFAALAVDPDSAPPAPTPRTTTAGRKASERAAAELEARGA